MKKEDTLCGENLFVRKFLMALCLFLSFFWGGCNRCLAAAKFTKTFLVYYGGGKAFRPGDEVRLARFDILDVDRFRYKDINGETWDAIKHLNPNIRIFLYQLGPEIHKMHDGYKPMYLNDIGRFNISRRHSMGSLVENPEFFLLDEHGDRIINRHYPNCFLLDFGSFRFQKYWIEATISDIVSKPWKADGVFVDNCLALDGVSPYLKCKKYPEADSWNGAMNRYISTITAALHANGQEIFVNKGNTRFPSGFQAWIDLDKSSSPPDIVMEEGAFAVHWGKGDVQFYPESEWKRQIDVVKNMQNSKIAYLSHTDLNVDETGLDNYGKPVTFRQVLWYALASYQLAKTSRQNKLYFMFEGNCKNGSYKRIWWFDEYDFIDLGEPVSEYCIERVNDVSIYYREFEKGYVYVNPTSRDVLFVSLPTQCTQLRYNLAKKKFEFLEPSYEVSVPSHHGVFLYKVTPERSARLTSSRILFSNSR